MNTETGLGEAKPATVALEDLASRNDIVGLPEETEVLRAIERVFGAKPEERLFALIVRNAQTGESTFIAGFASGRKVDASLPDPLNQIVWEMLEGSREHRRSSNLMISWEAGKDEIHGDPLKESDPNVQAVRMLQRKKSLVAGGLMGMAKKAGSFLTFKAAKK